MAEQFAHDAADLRKQRNLRLYINAHRPPEHCLRDELAELLSRKRDNAVRREIIQSVRVISGLEQDKHDRVMAMYAAAAEKRRARVLERVG